MALILCIETGTEVCSAALAQGGRMIAIRESAGGYDHARKLAPYIDEILHETGYGPEDLGAVAVAKGPGSYTGLRIGVSTAKGLCYALGIPLIGIGSLESLAYIAQESYLAGMLDVADWENARLCPMIDARRMEVYTQVFDSGIGALTQVEAHVVVPESFADFRRGPGEFLIFGNGAGKCVEVMSQGGLPVRYVEIGPSARGLVAAAELAFAREEFEDIAYFEPFYLKDFVAGVSAKDVLRGGGK